MNRYNIWDISEPLFTSEHVVMATTAIGALRQYLKDNNLSGTVKRCSLDNVRFRVHRSFVDDGKEYKVGNICWFEYLERELS